MIFFFRSSSQQHSRERHAVIIIIIVMRLKCLLKSGEWALLDFFSFVSALISPARPEEQQHQLVILEHEQVNEVNSLLSFFSSLPSSLIYFLSLQLYRCLRNIPMRYLHVAAAAFAATFFCPACLMNQPRVRERRKFLFFFSSLLLAHVENECWLSSHLVEFQFSICFTLFHLLSERVVELATRACSI